MATINISDIVTNDLDGTGSFDKLMNAVEIRLETQYREGKIKGTDYANVYLGSMQAVLQQAISYTLGVQQADKQADLISEQILKTQAEVSAIASEEALTDQRLLTEQAQILDTVNGNAVVGLIGSQKSLTTQQIAKLLKEESLVDEQIFNSQAQRLDTVDGNAVVGILGAQKALTQQQTAKLVKDEDLIDEQIYNSQAQRLDTVNSLPVVGVLGAEIALKNAQASKVAEEELLVIEQKYSQQAQRLDTVDGNSVVGILGAQKALTEAQTSKVAEDELLVEAQKFNAQAQRLNTVDGVAVSGILGSQKNINDNQAAKIVADTSLVATEESLIDERIFTEQAQRLDTVNGLTVEGIIGSQKSLNTSQAAKLAADTSLVTTEELLVDEKIFTEQAQRLDTVDGQSVAGVIGLQKTLTTNQASKVAADTTLVGKEGNLIDERVFTEQAQRLDTVDGVAVAGILGSQKTINVNQAAKLVADTALVSTEELLTSERRYTEQAQRLDTVNGLSVAGVIGAQKTLTSNQASKVTAETTLIGKEGSLVDERVFTEQAQRLDTVNGLSVAGIIGDQKALVVQQTSKTLSETNLVNQQIETETAQTEDSVTAGTVTGVIGKQKALLTEQASKTTSEKSLLDQKKATELGQIQPTGVDADSILGKQKALYDKQATGFDRDAEVKAAKVATDLWSISKSVDSSYIIPPAASAEAGTGTLQSTVKEVLNNAGLATDLPV